MPELGGGSLGGGKLARVMTADRPVEKRYREICQYIRSASGACTLYPNSKASVACSERGLFQTSKEARACGSVWSAV